MAFLTGTQTATLHAICETLVPPLECETGDDPRLFAPGADDVDLADRVLAAIEEVADESQRRKLARFLSILESPLAGALAAGHFGRFSRLNQAQRTAVLRAWGNSSLPAARRAFQGIKRLALFLFYSSRPADGENPAWPAFAYPPTCQNADRVDATPRLPLVSIDRRATLDAGVLVIGSGAGGGVVAARLAAAGHDVLVVEKGGYFHGADFPRDEQAGFQSLYERHGSLSTDDLGFVVLAGSTVGGGTTVNWMTSLRTPPEVRDEWSREFGFREATSSEFDRRQETVLARLGVNVEHSQPNGANAALERGCQALGYRVAAIPRNAEGCLECDYCGYGCRYGAKRDVRATYLADACRHGARLLPAARVERILHEAGRVHGANLTVQAGNASHDVTVRAKIVVVSAGSIHTPAILRRSGLTNRHIGRNLHLHPTTAVFARYAEPIHAWRGPPQTRYCDHFANLDGRGHGVRIETCPAHPGLWALGLPWQGGREHKRLMAQLAHFGNLIILSRDEHGGEVRINAAGEPVIRYRLHAEDEARLTTGAIEALRIQAAAGALEIYSPHNRTLSHTPGTGSLDDFLSLVRSRGLPACEAGLFSAHELSSCRLAADPRQGAVNPEGESFEVRGLYVADGSLLPTACGVNPMITIMTLADHVAACIAARR